MGRSYMRLGLVIGCLLGLVGLGACSTLSAPTPHATQTAQLNDYGVFVGLDSEQSAVLSEYGTVVIDAEYYSTAEIEHIKQVGTRVYSYLNIGSIETFRDVYSQFESHTLGEYENWPGEYWMDVSLPAWQEHIATAARLLVDKGVQGFFLDNTDVYDQFHTMEILEGLVTIINELEETNVDILINGGDVFVTETILEPATPTIHITGVNQETVFSGIDFENEKLGTQDLENSTYYQEYLEQCEQAGLRIYLLEYVEPDDDELRTVITDYCTERGYTCYIADSIDLRGGV